MFPFRIKKSSHHIKFSKNISELSFKNSYQLLLAFLATNETGQLNNNLV